MNKQFLFGLILSILPLITEAANCPDAAVVVVASVFSTLAVVFIVLGIIAFLLWKRRRDISRPEKLRHEGDSETGAPPHLGYSNPAFEKGEKEPENGGTGVPGYVACKDLSPDKKKSPIKSILDKEMAKKTWSSLPKSDFPNINRQNSVGSLDRNYGGGEPDIVSVWLQSQDFIGLGFNIAGSMRDGIFVSQVHNRGPAIESGKFKVGDRILSVTVSFENMVYEDALTILSYASPYPVQICLQKQEQMPKGRRMSDARTSLNHPLYRSQSVDALHGIGKEPIFHPKRSLSEMRSDKRDSPKIQHISRASLEKHISEESYSPSVKSEQDVPKLSPVSTAEVTVHRDDARNEAEQKLSFDKQFSVDSGVPNATVDLNHVNDNRTDTRFAKVIREGEDELDTSAQLRNDHSPNQTDFADLFDKLTEQDKLDVIRLSYEDSYSDTSKAVQSQVVEAEISPSLSNGDLKAVKPVKPERKKKRSSSSSLDGDPPLSPRSANIDDDDVMVCILQPPTEAPPPVPEDEQEFEAEEDMITPQTKTRNISVDTDKITFEPATPVQLDASDLSFDKTLISQDDSFSDVDKTLTLSPDHMNRPHSPDEEPVTEDEIAPVQRRKDNAAIPALNIAAKFDTDVKHQKTENSDTTLENSVVKSYEFDESNIQKGRFLIAESEPNVDAFEKDFPNLDMNLNFESDSVLFKETYPSRNTKENGSGISYDISVTELEAMENKVLKDIAKQNDNQKGSGGVAFEVRDDYTSGVQQTVTTKSVHRTSSYEFSTNSESPVERHILNDRPNSMKLDINKSSEFDSGGLDWSGKRLVRSGSFSEIPQDDSVKNWTDNQNLSDDDVMIEQHIQEDSATTNLKKLTKATTYKATTNMDDLTDSDSHCRSLSSSSSDISRERESYDVTNGPDDGLGSSPDTSPLKINQDMKSDLISPVFANKGQSITVTLNTSIDNDADC